MGILNRSDKVATTSTDAASVIAVGTKITGKVNLEINLFVNGEIEGEVLSSTAVSIGAQGKVTGEINAAKVIVGGEMHGKINCVACEILAGGKIIGEVVCETIVIELGGMLEGSSKRKLAQKQVEE